MADTKQFTITIQRIIKEEYAMVLETETAMQAFDTARQLVASRKKDSTVGTFTVTKVEEKL